MIQSKKQAYNKKKKHFGHLWPFWGCCSYHAVIVKIPRLLCIMNQYVGMLQYQKILRRTQFVGCRAKNRHTTRKKAFWSFKAILEVLQLPNGNSLVTKASVCDESVCWHAPVSKDTKTDTICMMQSRKQAYNKKKELQSFMAFLGVLQLPCGNSQDTKASVYNESVCWHDPVSKDTQTDTICRMKRKKQANHKKKGILVIYGHFGGVVANIL